MKFRFTILLAVRASLSLYINGHYGGSVRMMRRLRQDERGINNVITAMLGLIIIVIIVANVFIWNYEMNAIDLEKSQEQISIESINRGNSASYNPTGYNLLQGTRLMSGSTTNLASDDSVYMTVRSPRGYARAQVEFTGTSDLGNWTALTWKIDSAWSQGNVAVTFQLFDYNLGAYPTSGDGFISYNSSVTPYVDETKGRTITVDAIRFLSGSGQWKIMATGTVTPSTQFDMEIDSIEVRVSSANEFLLRNGGPVTVHVVSLWVVNSAVHQRYGVDVYLNSGEAILFKRDDIAIPSGQCTVRIVTERGNIAVFTVP
jgi:hypothetical protein